MKEQKKFVEDITSMDVDFAKWYTDIVKKADLIDYSGVRGCMVIQPLRLCNMGEYTKRLKQAF